MNYLITGAAGFVSWHLIDAIFKKDPKAQITGVDLVKPIDPAIGRPLQFIADDLSNVERLAKILETAQPRFIIHLASSSAVARSWQYPGETFKNNTAIFLNLLEAVRLANVGIRILAVGSSEQYGIVSADKIPLKEAEPPNPMSPYAVARVAQEYLSAVYTKGYKLDIVSTRSFNHFGPGQDSRFVLPGFAKQVAEIKLGLRSSRIDVGELDIVRDFTDVRDVVNAYLALLDRGIAGEIYNVCCGHGRTIKDCLRGLITLAGVECEITKRPDLIRPIDNPIIVGDNSKIKSQTGWAPTISFETTLGDIYKYWLSKVMPENTK